MYNNSALLKQKLELLAKSSGFITLSIGDYYVQFSKDENSNDVLFEAVSHEFLDTLPKNRGKKFKELGFSLKKGENFSKTILIRTIRQRYDVVYDCEIIFDKIYKTNYDIPFQVTDEIESFSGPIKVNCSNCKEVLEIREELQEDDMWYCPICKTNFNNPNYKKVILKPSKALYKPAQNETISNANFAKIIRVGLIITTLAIFGYFIDKNDGNGGNDNIEVRVKSQVKQYLDNNLNDPNSYESVNWSKVLEVTDGYNYKYKVRHIYRAKNAFGGLILENQVFRLDKDFNIVEIKE